MLETPEETKALAIAGPQCPGNARLAKGTVTCLSVGADLFQLQASCSVGHVMSTVCCLRASCHKPPVRNVDSGHNTLHAVANDQSACLRTLGYNVFLSFFGEVSNYIQILACG